MEQDRKLDRYVSGVLRAGMALSISVLAIGLLMYALLPEAEASIPPGQLLEGLMSGSPVAVIELGILLLILTPLSRVVAAAVIFAAERDLRFVLTSLAVLGAITLAVLL